MFLFLQGAPRLAAGFKANQQERQKLGGSKIRVLPPYGPSLLRVPTMFFGSQKETVRRCLASFTGRA